MKNILIINGANLNLLGKRDKNIYGVETLKDLENKCLLWSKENNANVDFVQSNHEGDLIDSIQNANDYDGIILNAGAYSHTSIALRDSIIDTTVPVYEVHISNIHSREKFRQNSYLSNVSKASICGCGILGYKVAIEDICKNKNFRSEK